MVAQPLRLGLRAAQFALSLIALSTIAASFRSATASGYNDDFDFVKTTATVGSPATTFGMLMTYTTMLYGLWSVVAVEIYTYAPRPTPLMERNIDGFFAVVLLITGIVLATSDFVAHCSALEGALRCGSLKAGVAFTFIAMAAFLATFGLNFLGASNAGSSNTSLEVATDYTIEGEYHGESTPKEALSPIGGTAKTPEAHV